MNYQTKITIPSTSLPGLFFTIRRMSDARRNKLREAIAPDMHSIRLALAEVQRIKDDATPDGVKLSKLSDDIDIASAGVNRAWLNLAFIAAFTKDEAGAQLPLLIDDKPATAESLIADGPTDLYTEITDAIKKAATLSGAESGELLPPFISGEPAVGQTNNSSVAVVDSEVTTSPETAGEPTPDTTS
jgi:hypothetical protein